jgi:hypothetical protein
LQSQPRSSSVDEAISAIELLPQEGTDLVQRILGRLQ